MKYPTAAELRQTGKFLHGTPADRLARCYVAEPSGCWRWLKGLTTSGYGHFSIRSVYYQAHLLLYILHVGPLPEGLEPDHLCRNRWCVNPADLEFVTHAVNMQRGARTRLTPEKVAAIRRLVAAGASQRAIAPIFGVDHSTISRLVRSERWPEPEPKAVAA